MLEKAYHFKAIDEKVIEKIIDDEVLEFFVLKALSSKNYGGK